MEEETLLGYVQIPLASLVETGHKETPVPYTVTDSTHRGTHVTQDLETSFQGFIDALVTRWENWDLPYEDKVVLTLVPVPSLVLLLFWVKSNEDRIYRLGASRCHSLRLVLEKSQEIAVWEPTINNQKTLLRSSEMRLS